MKKLLLIVFAAFMTATVNAQIVSSTSRSIKTTTVQPKESKYGKGWDHTVNLLIADGYGFGYDLRRNFNQYVGWDVVGIKFLNVFGFESPGDCGQLDIRLGGVRFNTPSIGWFRAYTSLDLGYTMTYVNTNRLYDEHGFGLDFGLGFQFHKHFSLGYNLNYATTTSAETHWCRFQIHF